MESNLEEIVHNIEQWLEPHVDREIDVRYVEQPEPGFEMRFEMEREKFIIKVKKGE